MASLTNGFYLDKKRVRRRFPTDPTRPGRDLADQGVRWGGLPRIRYIVERFFGWLEN